ncbi:Outer membrane efflux protein [Rosistilla ulvae]|uniref:Outer membrane efflux protein n=1 Tax=Rosistilla ulvae TaxID=1930277 RepID=A0A517LY56_9BACT|nr:TolC family protein [Rosistilla ulvae]QDS87556.1 Outer membrane efflux protein [Rosistilla ulvae]
MNRKQYQYAVYLQIALLVVATGCRTPTQPFYLHEDGDLSHYLDTATAIEYPDVELPKLEDVLQAKAPLTVDNHEYEFWDVTLEECVSIALNNSKILRTVSGTAQQRQNTAAQILSGSPDGLGSTFDPAIQSSTTQSLPLTVDSDGNRTLPRGAIRASQVGGVEDALSEFDAQMSSFLSYDTTDRSRNVGAGNIFNPQQFRAWDSTQQLALSKRLATGGVATLRERVVYSRNNITPDSVGRLVASDYTVVLEAQVQHPLMRNRGTLVNRVPVVLASLNEDSSLTEFESLVRNLVADVENAYWELYCAYRNVETTQIARDSAQATARFAQLNLESGSGTAQDVAQAEEQFFAFSAQLTTALAGTNVPGNDPYGVYGRERELRNLMGIASTDGRLARPIDEPSLAAVKFDWHELTTEALYRSPELRAQKIRIKQRELECLVAKNQMLPDLNVSFSARWVGVGDTLGPSSRDGGNIPGSTFANSALADLTEGDHTEVGARLEFTPPAIGSRREKARVRNAQLQLRREEAFLQEKELAMVHQLSDAVGKLQVHYDLIHNSFQRWAAAEREVRARLAEYEGGRSPVNVVLQSQQRRALAQIEYYRSLCEYNKSIAYVHYLKGTLLDYNNIALNEGPWADKAYWDALERARERDASYFLNYGYTRPGVVRQGPVKTNVNNVMIDNETVMGDEVGEIYYEDAMPMEVLPGDVEFDSINPPLSNKAVPSPPTSTSAMDSRTRSAVVPASFEATGTSDRNVSNPYRS